MKGNYSTTLANYCHHQREETFEYCGRVGRPKALFLTSMEAIQSLDQPQACFAKNYVSFAFKDIQTSFYLLVLPFILLWCPVI